MNSLDPFVTFTSGDEEESSDQDDGPFPREAPGKETKMEWVGR